MRKRIIGLLLLFLMLQIITTGICYSEDSAAAKNLEAANAFMNKYFGYTEADQTFSNYYKDVSPSGKKLNQAFASGSVAFNSYPVIVYGKAEDAAKDATKYGADEDDYRGGEYRAIGYSKLDNPFANPQFIPNTTKIKYKRWIKEPWKLPSIQNKQKKMTLSPDYPEDKHTYQYLDFEPDKHSSTYSVINQWIKAMNFTPDMVVSYSKPRNYFFEVNGKSTVVEAIPPGMGDNPEDYIFVIEPPTNKTWGVGIAFYYYGGTGANDSTSRANYYSYYEYFRLKPFDMVDNVPDFSARILRTGTENGFDPSDTEREYEAVVEFDAGDYNKAQVPNIRLMVTGGYFSETEGNVVDGGFSLSASTLSSWLEANNLEKGTKSLPDLTSGINSVQWLQNLTGSGKEDKEYRMAARKIDTRGTGANTKYIKLEEKSSKRYYVFKWKVNENAPEIRLSAKINQNGDSAISESDIKNNSDVAPIYKAEKKIITDKYLDYDVYSKEFEAEINGGNILEAAITEPEPKGYEFRSVWNGNTTGELLWRLSDVFGLVKGSNLQDINNQYGYIDEANNSIVRSPVVRWLTGRESFGYSLGAGKYSGNSNYSAMGIQYSGTQQDNGKAPKLGFTVDTWGRVSRSATTSYYTGKRYHSHSSGCYSTPEGEDEVSTLVCGYSDGEFLGYTGATTELVTKDADFIPKASDNILIQAFIYNGATMKERDMSEDEGVETKTKGIYNKLVWEGDRYPVNVDRYMRKLNVNGDTTGLVATPGFHGKARTFQHLDSAEVTLSKVYTLESNFEEDRQKAYKNPRNYKNKKFEKAPFATDTELQKFDYPIKSGYFYMPYAVYEARVRTEKYINGEYTGKTSEHERIVDNVKNAFSVQLGIPTVNSSKAVVTGLPVLKTGSYALISNDELKYDNGPAGINEYLYGTEKSLLGKTDSLFKAILEGWSFSGTEDSWGDTEDTDARKYREYIKSANIHKVIEETTITFTVNPEQLRYYININAKNNDYKINVSLGTFSNGRSKPLTAKGPDSLDAITFSVRGSRLDDLDN